MEQKRTATHIFLMMGFGGSFYLCFPLAISSSTFADMTTYYCHSVEEALRRAKKAGKIAEPGLYFGGITLKSSRRGFAIYREGKVIEQYSVIER